jgi:flagellin-like protein
MKQKKAVSPVIATILLIALVLIIALIIFLWFRQLTQEETIKFGKNIELVCDDVRIRASYSSGTLHITNDGSVPIESFKLKTSSDGDYSTSDLSEVGPVGEGQGAEKTIDLDSHSEVYLIPVLRGTSNSGQKNFVCENKEIKVK